MMHVGAFDGSVRAGYSPGHGEAFGPDDIARLSDGAEDVYLARGGGRHIDEIVRLQIDVLAHVAFFEEAHEIDGEHFARANEERAFEVREFFADTSGFLVLIVSERERAAGHG